MEKQLEAQRKAREILEKMPDWATFYREVLGVGGIVRQLYPTPHALMEFEKTSEYAELQSMLAKLREKNKGKTVETEPTKVITVRLPKSLQEALDREANEHGTSVNQLCISKLLQVIDGDLVPTDKKDPPRKAKMGSSESEPEPVEQYS
jgi:predicted HicB family RNase H-like nuclease